ncbi:hypothetical protein EDB81DRAFT_656955 [Dactylonectria macrodidyma]|uniref:HTH La-type RNA-binding domain-containing protein n=1 Tax=Dactylonectria macrodidyma TaxID=307937 RepID=A0A9P9EFL6_9HYPO|nr:hypothetical protein EDB81DRAFT_656955 [Dactylonectria macrodidyma]
MTSVAAANSSEMSAASTFSYAQAAKGQGAASPSNPSAVANTQPQDTQVPDAIAAATTADSALIDSAAPNGEQLKSTELPETVNGVDAQSVAPEKQDIDNIAGSESDTRSESTQDRRPDSRREDDASRLDRPWRRNDKAARSSSTTTRSTDEQDSRKARRNKKGKASEKQTGDQEAADKEQEAIPEPPKVELSEAPIPSVNIWHQRKEAHQAKGQSISELANGQQEGPKAPAKGAEEATPHSIAFTNGVKPHRKATDAARPERNGPRGSRAAEKDGKDGKDVPPSVDDASSWPTPETAIREVKDDKKKPVERSNQSDKDSQEEGQGKSRQKEKWVTYDYVPTVSFETQLPQMRNSKPRGGARSARDTGARATTNGVTDKAPAAPLNKANESKPREASGPNGASVPAPVAKRGSLDASNNNQKKTSANADKAKDSTAPATENAQASRPDGRNERGRGGYRGRGAVNGQTQHQHSASVNGNLGFNSQAARAQGPYSPPLRQGAHGQIFMPPTQRGRGGRNGSGNYHRMSLPNGQSRMPAVQAQFGPYDYAIPPIAGMPFQPHPYWDNMVVPMLKSQIEYYFSIENLCKDMYLRARMDSQGFVPLHFIAAFKRMRDLSPDMGLIRAVCEDSLDVEYIVGEDDCERLRRREDWQKFVLPMEDRDELARNHGPAHLTYKNRAYAFSNQFNGVPAVPYGAYPNDPSFQQYIDSVQAAPAVNGHANVNGTTQLSAEVPDFSPTGTIPVIEAGGKSLKPEETSGLTNGHVEAPLTNGVHAEAH